MILGQLGLDIGPAVAGLGVVGIAVGFGAQSLVRDYLNGALILIENQFGKGDVVRIAGVAGTVEDFSLRRTTLRDLDGVVHTVPNGEIKVASNLTRVWARINQDVTVAYGTDIDQAIEVVDDGRARDGRRPGLEAAHPRGAAGRARRGARRDRRHAQDPRHGPRRRPVGRARASSASACSPRSTRNGIEIPRPQRVVLTRDAGTATARPRRPGDDDLRRRTRTRRTSRARGDDRPVAHGRSRSTMRSAAAP